MPLEEVMAQLERLDPSEITEDVVMAAARLAYADGYGAALEGRPSEVEA